ncbi:MAG: hypothetical protein HY930_04245 [Euryarchaeota archaeon]|nr:hypothetical protein [Euryarchaeota archaeon]
MKKIIFALLVIAAIAAQTLVFYRGIYIPPPIKIYELGDIALTRSPTGEFPEAVEKKAGGIILFDLSHENRFLPNELNALYSRIIFRNYTVEYLREADKLNVTLENASAFVVIAPKKAFSKEEILLVEKFLSRNGKLLLIADPGRTSEINALSMKFGIIFEDDYLYNLRENDGNFQYIFLKNFRQNSVTKNLSKVAFYAAGSITSPNGKIILTDENTTSSGREGKEFAVAVLLEERRVLAIGDFTFFTSPYNAVLDNPKFISNIADYLTN